MAKKVMLMKMLQEIRGLEVLTHRRPTPRPAIIYLMKLREQATQNHQPKQRLAIIADWQNGPDIPLPVKIRHFNPAECEFPVVIV